MVASAGLAAAGIMLAALGTSAGWTMHQQREMQRQARKQQTQAVASLVGRAAENMMAAGELSALRSMTAGLPPGYGLSRVQIVLGNTDRTVVADSENTARYEPIPTNWTTAANVPTEPMIVHTAGLTEATVPVNLPGRGAVLVVARNEQDYPLMRGWEAQFGVGAIAACAMSMLWLAYRTARRRLRGVGAICDALKAMSAGERSAAMLMVSPHLGMEAAAWNEYVREIEQLRERVGAERAGEKLGARRGGESELASVCDSLWQGVMLVDDKMNIRFANGAARVFLGGKHDDLAGTPLTTLIRDERVLDTVRRVAQGASRSRTSVEVGVHPTGDPGAGGKPTSVLRFTVRPVRKGDTGAALIVVDDITQQKVADESRSTFVAAATHELRTPLTNVRLYVDQLVEDPDLDAPKRAQALNVVSQEIRRLERLVGDMLSVSEIEAGQLKLNRDDVRLEPLFEELRHDFEAQAAQKSIGLRFELPPKWPRLVGDRDKIVLALQNLVGNAIKYTPAGGQVVVRVGEQEGSLSIDVTDTGIGIKDEEMQLVFERFYRAKDRRIAGITGTGLGLSIARDVIRLHGGELSVRSQIDKGSTFTVSLPLAA